MFSLSNIISIQIDAQYQFSGLKAQGASSKFYCPNKEKMELRATKSFSISEIGPAEISSAPKPFPPAETVVTMRVLCSKEMVTQQMSAIDGSHCYFQIVLNKENEAELIAMPAEMDMNTESKIQKVEEPKKIDKVESQRGLRGRKRAHN